MYYKDDTHYFVMTAKKQCLLRLGVLHKVGPRPRHGGTEWWTLGGRVQAWTWSPPGCGGSPSCLQWHFLHLSKLFSTETYMAT